MNIHIKDAVIVDDTTHPSWIEKYTQWGMPFIDKRGTHSSPRPSVDPKQAIESTAYGLKALAEEYEKVAAAPLGFRNDQLNHSAFRLGQLYAGGELTKEDIYNGLTQAADQSRHDGNARATIRSGFEAGIKDP